MKRSAPTFYWTASNKQTLPWGDGRSQPTHKILGRALPSSVYISGVNRSNVVSSDYDLPPPTRCALNARGIHVDNHFMSVDPGTHGAVLLGVLFASLLSGVFAVQCLIYFKLYPNDRTAMKVLVAFVWFLEVVHTALIWMAMWNYFVLKFGEPGYIDFIPPSIALSVVLTAGLTFLTHCLLAHRIYHLSRRKLYLTLLVVILAFARLAAASVSGGEMIHLHSYRLFRRRYQWLFSVGLSLSSAVDILVSLSLFFLLRRSRQQSILLHRIIDSLILYTFEIGSLTSIATVASLLCWVLLDDSLVFLGLHFVIGKLYANSLLATLNARQHLRRVHTSAMNLMNLDVRQESIDSLRVQTTESQSEMHFPPLAQILASEQGKPEDSRTV
ncbi:unnamed protein product [Cyclocybe aegerita]|uniref:DUF6534 domain-containing protein n=1 Tax=Cyclocybe aegerita TaxID=1973307 RepID=A0A8S0W0A6_CYCAE|nr:unnamed protein product [Cyclocybe aegerita]